MKVIQREDLAQVLPYHPGKNNEVKVIAPGMINLISTQPNRCIIIDDSTPSGSLVDSCS